MTVQQQDGACQLDSELLYMIRGLPLTQDGEQDCYSPIALRHDGASSRLASQWMQLDKGFKDCGR